jgi:three-Cys-motif partner protein
MKNQPDLPYVQDDGLPIQDVGSWAEEKYRLVNLYNRLFSTGMKNKWDCRVYIDLYAGNGRSKIRETEHILESSPLLALGVPDKFNKYIFCEKDEEKLEILKQRVTTKCPRIDVSYIQGDCNSEVDKIIAAIPRPSSVRKVLSFCFVDPYNIGIRFDTIEKLSELFIDFLIVLAGGMDANRNERNYSKTSNKTVDTYLGTSEWRIRWQEAQKRRFSFASFLALEYADQMERLRYIIPPLHKMPVIRSDEKNLPLYHLAFFSRDKLGYKFWDQALKYWTDQQSLPFDQG